MKVFLGGTCAGTTWRNQLKPLLKIEYFDPVVEDWTPECQAEEERQKLFCPLRLYVITPEMKGVFSIAEAMNDSIKQNVGHTVTAILGSQVDWRESQFKSINAFIDLARMSGAHIIASGYSYWTPLGSYKCGQLSDTEILENTANYLNAAQ